MASIVSKNPYDLLENDPELEQEPRAPAKASKAAAPSLRPTKPADSKPAPRNTRRHEYSGNEQAFRDRNAGSQANHSRTVNNGEGSRGRGRGRGGRGRGRGGNSFDRHSRTGVTDHEKQVAHGWGGKTGDAEWTDEKAGENIAKDDEKVEGTEEQEEVKEPEPEDKSKSYVAYLAEQTEQQLSLGLGPLEARKPNEGSGQKFPQGKAFVREDDEYFIGGENKSRRVKERKEKVFVELDDARLREEPQNFRGRGRGGRGPRGGRGGPRGGRGENRGGRGRDASGPNVDDKSAFPTLGSA